MPTFGEEMRRLASELTEDFSEEIGKSSIHHITGRDYDTEEGKNTNTFLIESTYIVFEDINSNEVNDISYTDTHMKATIAGDEITFIPAIDDIVETPEKTYHRVDRVIKDQYNAAHILYVEMKHVTEL